ncbi:MAG: malto-oligosyltrehalose synthase [Desulfotomaculales bacterium]
MACARIPVATYRLQFNREFGLADACTLVPYLDALGITDIYASPLLQARRGSTHGYDVTDPTRLNPELGGEDGFTALAGLLRARGMGMLLDIVPNHMAAATENPWWLDVLRYEPDSAYASYFDIDWEPARPGLAGRVLLPILGAPYGSVLENGELTLAPAEDGFWVGYGERRLPISPRTYGRILSSWPEALAGALGSDHPAVSACADLLDAVKRLPAPTEAEAFASRFQEVRHKLWRLYNTSSEVKAVLDESLKVFNGRKGDPQSFDRLDRLLAEQPYRLAFWRVGNQEVNYRRFFDVSDFVCVRVEQEHVFAATHALVLRLAAAGQVTGLRIDHIDGLYDPAAYLRRLQDRLGAPGEGAAFYVVAEKILSSDEELPAAWPVHGTTGYDFLNAVNGLFVDGRGAAALGEIYAGLGGCEADFATVVYDQKRRVMRELFPGEVRNLTRELALLAEHDRYGRDLTLPELEDALVETTACLPVYRTYIRAFPVERRDRTCIEHAAAEAVRRSPAARPACDFLRRVLLLAFPGCLAEEQRQAWLRFVMRWQQFTGPVMAKGFEDTALYLYNRLVSLNEVGGNPQSTGMSVAELHRRHRARQERWPHTLNATSTHDTKRGEDVRARINVLSEIPAAWAGHLERWRAWNRPKKPVVHGEAVPDDNTELLIYQTLVGAWPLREKELPAFRERLEGYLVKAAREAKVHTHWLHPDAAYEDALLQFARSILDPADDNRFLEDFTRFQQVAAYYGALNSLAQVLLKIASPGMPDFYRGTEIWDFSLVDPDNRRPVDFETRAAMLAALRGREGAGLPALAKELLDHWQDGRIKLYVTYKALTFRRSHRELFAAGEYVPLEAAGPRREHVCAFARRHGAAWALVAVPRLMARLAAARRETPPDDGPADLPPLRPPLGEATWGKTSLLLPAAAPDRWRNVFTGETVAVPPAPATGTGPTGKRSLPLAGVLRRFPVALLAMEPGM